MPAKVHTIPLLAASGIAAMGIVSGVETLYMTVGLTGLMTGVAVWIILMMLDRTSARRRASVPRNPIPNWADRACVLVLTALFMILQVVVCMGLVLAMSEREAVSAVVCAAAALVLGRVSLRLVAESISSIRALIKRREYA